MPTSFLPYEPNQDFLLPPSLSEWLPENHLGYLVSEIIDRLGLQTIYSRHEGDGRRNKPFDPAMLVKVLVYGYATGVFSSRKIARKLTRMLPFECLGRGNFPSHPTICDLGCGIWPNLKSCLCRWCGSQKSGVDKAWSDWIGRHQDGGIEPDRKAIDSRHYPATARMAERLASQEGQAHYRRRK